MSSAIAFESVSKSFKKGPARYRSLRDDLVTMLTPWSWARHREQFWALRDVSFAVPAGGALGIIGPNGAGKSTALKLIARITHPSTGIIRLRGRIGALIEIGAGIHPELTGRENIYMYGSLMGLRDRDIRRKFDQIVDFAELEEFIDTPVKFYSSGMQVRLGFSVAAHIEVDVLLVDEVLAVGDAAFQTKCLRRIRDLRTDGVAILLVSHQLANIQRVCPETILLVNGQIAAGGPTAEVISKYYQILDSLSPEDPEAALMVRRLGAMGRNRKMRIEGVRLLDRDGQERAQFQLGEDAVVRVEYAATERVEQPNFTISFNSSDWSVYTGADTKNDGVVVPSTDGRGYVELEIPRLGLGPGLYEVNVGIWDEGLLAPYDWRWGVKRFVVDSSRNLFAGRFELPHTWAWRDGSHDKRLEAVMAPTFGDAPTQPLPREMLDEFQDTLRTALQAFLNGDFVVWGSSKRELLKPLRMATCRVPWNLLAPSANLLARFSTTHGSSLRPDGARLLDQGQRRGWLAFDEAATVLADLYRLLDQLLEDQGRGASQEIEVLQAYDSKVYLERGLIAVDHLAAYARRELAPHVWGFYLHGSLSTLDYTPYSDADDFMVIKRDTVLDAAALQHCAAKCLAASHFLYEHDPLQHHRHFIITEIDLHRYPAAFLPPEILRFATAVIGPHRLAIGMRESSTTDGSVRTMAHELANWGTPNAVLPNTWHLKYLLSSVLLLPALYLQSRGTPCYKKFSFERARPAFGAAWRAVDLASELRRTWTYSPTARERLLQLLSLEGLRNPVLFEYLMARWAQPIAPSMRAVLEREGFSRSVGELGRATLDLLRHEKGGAHADPSGRVAAQT